MLEDSGNYRYKSPDSQLEKKKIEPPQINTFRVMSKERFITFPSLSIDNRGVERKCVKYIQE